MPRADLIKGQFVHLIIHGILKNDMDPDQDLNKKIEFFQHYSCSRVCIISRHYLFDIIFVALPMVMLSPKEATSIMSWIQASYLYCKWTKMVKLLDIQNKIF